MADTETKKVTREDLKQLAANEMSKLRGMMRSNNQLASALESALQKRSPNKQPATPRQPRASA